MGIGTDGFGTLFSDASGGGGDPSVRIISVMTTNAVPTQIFQHMCSPNTSTSFRATITATRSPTASIVGRFIREFTVKRVGVDNSVILQDLIPSPDYYEDASIGVDVGADTVNATLTATGMAGTLVWHGRVEIV
jgi:hypothetical protein